MFKLIKFFYNEYKDCDLPLKIFIGYLVGFVAILFIHDVVYPLYVFVKHLFNVY